MPASPLILIRAGAVLDAADVSARPGALAVRDGHIVAAGGESDVRRQAGAPDRVVELPDRLLMPAMVNAHAHLDLTDIERQPYQGEFIGWIESVIRQRPREEAAISRAVRRGLELSKDAGVVAVGDIAGSPAAARARIFAKPALWLAGTSWLECFGIGRAGRDAARGAWTMQMALLQEQTKASLPRTVKIGLQPHAPYSAGAEVYSFANDPWFGIPSTHLAETPEEAMFVRAATGPFADLLKRLGKWDETIQPAGVSPIAHFVTSLAQEQSCEPWVLAHCNYTSDTDLDLLRQTRHSIAYCPLASDYFGHRNHRYRDMLAAGINVCLGTDSIICQPAHEPQPLGILPQMRHLYRRDRTDPRTLLKMATMNGATALGLGHDQQGTLAAGQLAALMHAKFDPSNELDPLEQVLRHDEVAKPIEIAQDQDADQR